MIKLLCVVDTYKHYNEPIKELEKRLGKKIEIIKLKPSKSKDIKKILKEETQLINNELMKLKGHKVLLDIDGDQFNTEEFKQYVEEKEANFGIVCFIIAGAYGLDQSELKVNIDFKLSLSKMTFPHIEAILILMEQIYRIDTMKKGTGYHH